MSPSQPTPNVSLERLAENFEYTLQKLERAKPFARPKYMGRFLDQSRRLMAAPGGADVIYKAAPRFDAAGVFADGDWEAPQFLNAILVPMTFQSGEAQLVTIECLSECRMLAIARGDYFTAHLSDAQARHFLTKVLALNLHLLFGTAGEAERNMHATVRPLLRRHLEFIANHIGVENVLDEVVTEVWRLLAQRPVHIDQITTMITRIAECIADPELTLSTTTRGVDTLVSAVFGPTLMCREDPGVEVYLERVAGMHHQTLSDEAHAFARAMHDTGLVSPYHAALVRRLPQLDVDLIPTALGLSATGRDVFYSYRDLILTLIEMCVHPETRQAVFGLSGLLERGILYQTSVSSSLWRQTTTPIAPEVQLGIQAVYGTVHPPHVYLLSGIMTVLGRPLGLGQGNNPVCQSTRAISMWADSNPDYLLQLTRWAARDNNIEMTFEGQVLSSASLPDGASNRWYIDLDPLSLVLMPHLDKIYHEMARLCIGRTEDYHKWINPEFHGWRVHRGFAIAVDVQTGLSKDLPDFVSRFYTLYHPYHNNNTPVVHPQPAGIAFTDGHARYVGWHAITILRVAIDHEGQMRVYFFNPNNDSGQNWGNGVVVSTHGHGERPGESSLPFDQFTSRLYIFHYDPSDFYGFPATLDSAEIDAVLVMARESWVAGIEHRVA